MRYLLGIDLGTSGCKALLMDEKGKIIAKNMETYPTEQPFPGWSEQSPEDWYQAVCAAIRGVVQTGGVSAKDVVSLAVSGQMVGLVAVDRDWKPIRPCILWNDQRSVRQADSVLAKLGLDRIVEETGNVVFPSFFAPKILWMKENEPEKYARIKRVLFPKDYIVFRLTGEWISEVSDFSGSCLMNVRKRTSSSVMMDAFAVKPSFLAPVLLESEDAVGPLTGQAALDTGLSPQTLVGAGGGDQSCQAIGSGIVKPDRCGVTIGTSGVVFLQTERYTQHPEGRIHAFRHSVRNQFYLMGVMLSAGGSYQWLRRVLRHADGGFSYERMNGLAAQAPAGCDGLFFLPYLTGERCPHNDPYARGGWIGMTSTHELPHLVRSVMEGITFGLYDCLELIKSLGNEVAAVYASGGAAASGLWLQIISDVFDLPVCVTNATEGAALGAALLAGSAAGVFPSAADAAQNIIKVTRQYEPDSVGRELYRNGFPAYQAFYRSLKDDFRSMAGHA